MRVLPKLVCGAALVGLFCALAPLLSSAHADTKDEHGPGIELLIESISWSPDGARFVLSSDFGHHDGPDGDFYIWTVNIDGTNLTQITAPGESEGYKDRNVAWSPDGEKIAFDSNRNNLRALPNRLDLFQIFTVNPNGSGLTQVTTTTKYAQKMPAWRPDGERFAVITTRAGTDLIVISADGNTEYNYLAGSQRHEAYASWSPDGSRVCYRVVDRFKATGDEARLVVCNADGSSQAAIHTSPDWLDLKPAWSPTADLVAFIDRDYSQPNQLPCLWTIDSSGNNLTKVLDFRAAGLSRELGSPTWSPDGQRIAFVVGNYDTHEAEIWHVRANGTNLTKVPITWPEGG